MTVARAGFFIFVAAVLVGATTMRVGGDAGQGESCEDDQAQEAFHLLFSLCWLKLNCN